MKKIILCLAAVAVLAGCKTESAPEINDVNNIVVDGKKYNALGFVKEFCQFEGAATDKNCMKADEQRIKDQSKFQAVPW